MAYCTPSSVGHLAGREFLVKYHAMSKIMPGGSKIRGYGVEYKVL